MLIWQKIFLWKSVIFHSITLPFDTEVDEKLSNVIYSTYTVKKIVHLKEVSKWTYKPKKIGAIAWKMPDTETKDKLASSFAWY